MSAKSERRVVEWELYPARKQAYIAPTEVEIEAVDAIEEPLPAPGKRTEIIIVVDPQKVGHVITAAGAASVPIGGVVLAVVYFETIILVLKWIVLGAGCLVGFVLSVYVLGSILRHMAMTSRSSRQGSRHSGWSTGSRQGCGCSKTTVNQSARTIINHFY